MTMKEQFDIENFKNTAKFLTYTSGRRDLAKHVEEEIDDFFDISCFPDRNVERWSIKKQHLFEAFGDKLKIKVPLEDVVVDREEVSVSIERFIDENIDTINPLILIFIRNLSYEELADNRLSKSMSVLDKTFNKGTRVSKCIGELCPEEDRDKVQTLFSTFVQGLKTEGNLVLSIDPLDFLTMSVNRSGWSSCHHPQGSYGAGGISYMNDGVSVIGYIETKDPIKVSISDQHGEKAEMTIPNKIWRTVVLFNEDFTYGMQTAQYPNNSIIYTSEMSKLIEEIIGKMTRKQAKTVSHSRRDETYHLVRFDDWELEGLPFYCDYRNNNMDGFNVTFIDDFENVEELEEGIGCGDVEVIVNGAVSYCFCGCEEVNYTDCIFVEESNGEDFYDYF